MNTRSLIAALGVATLCALSSGARANIIPVETSIVPSGGMTTYNYRADLSADQQLLNGDFFTLYDFRGLIAGSITAPAGWVGSQQPLGINPPSVSPSDDPSSPNITFTYVGAPTGSGELTFATFSAQSDFVGSTSSENFAGLAHRSTGPQTGTPVSNIGFVTGPGTPTSVPEAGSTLALLSASILGIGVLRKRMS